MTNITFNVDKELHKRMKEHPEIKWSEILRRAIMNYLTKIEKTKKITVREFRTRLDKELLDSIDSLNTKKEIEFYKKTKELESQRSRQLDEMIRR